MSFDFPVASCETWAPSLSWAPIGRGSRKRMARMFAPSSSRRSVRTKEDSVSVSRRTADASDPVLGLRSAIQGGALSKWRAMTSKSSYLDISRG